MKNGTFVGIIAKALIILLMLAGCDTGGISDTTTLILSGDVFEEEMPGNPSDATYIKTEQTGNITANIGGVMGPLAEGRFSITLGEPLEEELGDFSTAPMELFGQWQNPVLSPDTGVGFAALSLKLGEIPIQQTDIKIILGSESTSIDATSVGYLYVDQDVTVTLEEQTEPLGEEDLGTLTLNRAILRFKRGWNALTVRTLMDFGGVGQTMTVSAYLGVPPGIRWVLSVPTARE